jgi:hypothetical protein
MQKVMNFFFVNPVTEINRIQTQHISLRQFSSLARSLPIFSVFPLSMVNSELDSSSGNFRTNLHRKESAKQMQLNSYFVNTLTRSLAVDEN